MSTINDTQYIVALIQLLAQEGDSTQFVLRRSAKGPEWIASVQAHNGDPLCDKNGDQMLCAQHVDPQAAITALNLLCK